MMNMNTIIQRNNLIIQNINLMTQNINSSDITTTEALAALGIGLALGVVLMLIVNWLMNR
jgi:hypothetical protein